MWLLLLLWGSWAPTPGASQGIPVSRFCPVLEFWDLDHRCSRRCVERFGLPSCQDYEVSPNCGLSDFGDHLGFPFVRCSQGMCNKGGAQKSEPCLDRTLPQAPVPPPSPRPSLPPSLSRAFAGTVWYLVGITALLLAGLLLWAALQTFWARAKGKERVAEAREMCKLFPLTEWSVPLTLACQPLSRLLDELEVLEELVVLLDPEPGPSGGSTWGTTRHLAARYGLPASWATFAYSLRPAHSPLRALLETVAARDPAAQLGQLADHLSQLGHGDALNVLLKLQ